MNKATETDYSKAWEKYTKSKDFKESLKVLHGKRVYSPYADNILRSAFDAGWSAMIQVIKKNKKP